MAFRPRVNDSIHIDQRKLTFSEHPSAPGMPYGQTGRRATVYQLAGQNGERYALKVFTAAFRSRQVEEQAGQLAGYAQLPGLTACEREVISLRRHASLVGQHAELEDAVLMPWIQGMTWQEVVMNRQAVTRGQSLMLAENLVRILAVMEQNGIAHCDLSAPNVIVNFTALGVGNGGGSSMELIDLEDMYAPGMGRPEKLPAGSAGYAHRRAVEGVWEAAGDRFAGAVLLAEMLGWCDERVRSGAFGEQFFDMSEMQQECERRWLLSATLEDAWGKNAQELFDQVWWSSNIKSCPPFTEWANILKIDVPICNWVVPSEEYYTDQGYTISPIKGWKSFTGEETNPGQVAAVVLSGEEETPAAKFTPKPGQNTAEKSGLKEIFADDAEPKKIMNAPSTPDNSSGKDQKHNRLSAGAIVALICMFIISGISIIYAIKANDEREYAEYRVSRMRRTATAVEQTATANAAFQSTQSAGLQNINGEVWNIMRNMSLISSGGSGELDHVEDGYLETDTIAPGKLKDFIVEVNFINPYDASFHAWDYGFLFRNYGSNDQFRLYVDSDMSWDLTDRTESDFQIIDSGNLREFYTGAGEENTLKLAVIDEIGYFFVNDRFVSTLDLSNRISSGYLSVAIGFQSGSEVDGESTGYRNVYLWSYE